MCNLHSLMSSWFRYARCHHRNPPKYTEVCSMHEWINKGRISPQSRLSWAGRWLDRARLKLNGFLLKKS
jgi:hypothetical protein